MRFRADKPIEVPAGSQPYGQALAEATAKLERSERLQGAMASFALVCGFEIDVETRAVVWSCGAAAVHGFEGDGPADLEQWLASYRPKARLTLQTAIDRALTDGTPWDLELQFLRHDGESVWVRCQGRAEMRGGRARRLCGAIQDITGRKVADEQIRKTLIEAAEARESSERQAVQFARQTAELALASEAAEEAARMKGSFLATMSHEIRTPMNGVLGMVSLLDGTTLSEEQREYLDTIRVSGESLLEIINDVLDYSKSEAGKTRFASIPFDLTRCCEEAADMLAAPAAAKRLGLSVFVSPECPSELRGDPGRLRQVLVNLIGNALKFTETGRVSLQVEPIRAGGNGQRFEVRDTGIGIARSVLPKLFEPFIQADSGTTRRFGGTGLGLAICKQIVEALGGSIGAYSEAGRGSTFWFELDLPVVTASGPVGQESLADATAVVLARSPSMYDPVLRYLSYWGGRPVVANSLEAAESALAAAQGGGFLLVENGQPFGFSVADAASLRERHPSFRCAIVSWPGASAIEEARSLNLPALYRPIKRARLLAWLTGQCAAPATPSEHGASAVSLRILVAEDNPVNQRIVMKMLERLGHDGSIAMDGREAVDRAQSEPFDLILMDCQMPEMDGFQAAREIRRRYGGPPIVALTANALEGDRQRCLDAGMDDYLPKPIDLAVLKEMIERWAQPAAAAQPV